MNESSLAHPDFPETPWTSADDDAACREGWNIFEAHGVLEIERIDDNDIEDAPQFTTDDAAVAHVSKRALAGSLLHLRAMAIHAHYALRIDYETGAPIHRGKYTHRFSIDYSLTHDSADGSGIPAIDHWHAIFGRATEILEISETGDTEWSEEIIGAPVESYENEP